MHIDSGFQQKNIKKNKQSFTSANYVKYYVRYPGNNFNKITNEEIIKTLQKRIIRFLNKFQKKTNVSCAKSSKVSENNLLDFATKLMLNDKDYARYKLTRSAYLKDNQGKLLSYILTGNDAFLAEEEAKNIGRTIRLIKNLGDSPNNKLKLLSAKTSYYNKIKTYIYNIFVTNKNNYNVIDLFFEARLDKKGKVTYNFIGENFKTCK